MKAILSILKQNLLELTDITKIVTSLLFFLTLFTINLFTTNIETFDCIINKEYFDNSYLCVMDYYAINIKSILVILDPKDTTEIDEILILVSVFLVGHLISSIVNLFITEPLTSIPAFQKEFLKKEFKTKEEEEKYIEQKNIYKEKYINEENHRKENNKIKMEKYKKKYDALLYLNAIFLGSFISLFFINWLSAIFIFSFCIGIIIISIKIIQKGNYSQCLKS